MKVYFQEVAVHAEKRCKCSCGRRVRRTKKFSQTINPFNKDVNGAVKTANDIYAEINRQAATWQSAPEKCAKCSEGKAAP